MKFLLTIIFFFLLTAFNHAVIYPVAKFYAYSQKVSKGANFSSAEKNKATYNNRIYIEVKKGRTITVRSLWMNGRKTEFTVAEVSSPVVYEKSIRLGKKAVMDTLVQATENSILQVTMNTAAESSAVTIPSRYRKYPVLIEYLEGRKQYFLGSKTWKEMEPEINQ